MIRLYSGICLLLFVLTGCKSAGHGVPRDNGETTVLDHVRLVDGTGAPAREKMALVIQADTITAVLPHGSDSLPAHARRFDMDGKVIMPPLVNAHGHVGLLYGTLQPGKKANFLVLDGNPTLDIKQTRNISSVWKNGQPTVFLRPPQREIQDAFQSP